MRRNIPLIGTLSLLIFACLTFIASATPVYNYIEWLYNGNQQKALALNAYGVITTDTNASPVCLPSPTASSIMIHGVSGPAWAETIPSAIQDAITRLGTLATDAQFAVGEGVKLKTGSNALTGTGQLSDGRLTIANTSIHTGYIVDIMPTSAIEYALYCPTIRDGVSFDVYGSDATPTFIYKITKTY